MEQAGIEPTRCPLLQALNQLSCCSMMPNRVARGAPVREKESGQVEPILRAMACEEVIPMGDAAHPGMPLIDSTAQKPIPYQGRDDLLAFAWLFDPSTWSNPWFLRRE